MEAAEDQQLLCLCDKEKKSLIQYILCMYLHVSKQLGHSQPVSTLSASTYQRLVVWQSVNQDPLPG